MLCIVLLASNGRVESADTAPSVVESSDVAQIEAIDAMLIPYLKLKR